MKIIIAIMFLSKISSLFFSQTISTIVFFFLFFEEKFFNYLKTKEEEIFSMLYFIDLKLFFFLEKALI